MPMSELQRRDSALTQVALSEIICDASLQMRVRLDPSCIDSYVRLYKRNVELPPLIVFRGYDDRCGDAKEPRFGLWLVCGFLRYQALLRLGCRYGYCRIVAGNVRAAFLYAAAANSCHGQPLADADRRRVAHLLLVDKIWRQWSDHQLAEASKLEPALIASVREEIRLQEMMGTLRGDGEELAVPSASDSAIKRSWTPRKRRTAANVGRLRESIEQSEAAEKQVCRSMRKCIGHAYSLGWSYADFFSKLKSLWDGVTG